MMKIEAERIAQAINALRPDWPANSLMTLLAKPELRTRPYADVAVALTHVATDPASATPARVIEAGPWWAATKTGPTTPLPVRRMCPTHPTFKADTCEAVGPCSSDFDPDVAAAGSAAVHAALKGLRP